MQVFLTALGFSFTVSVLLAGFLPWWSFVPVCFISGWWQGRRAFPTFFAGFLAVFFIWLGGAAYFDTLSEGRMTLKVAQILGLESKNKLMFLTPLVGGTLSGIGALTGFSFRLLFKRKY